MKIRTPFVDSRNQKLLYDSKQSTDLKVFNFPITDILSCCRTNPSCKITVDTDKDSWVVDCETHNDTSKNVTISIKGKQFAFDTSRGTIKLSGPGSDSLNLMLKYILGLLNEGASDEKIKQRCKTINKKILDYLGAHDHTEVPIELLERIYEKSINSERIDQAKVARSRTRNRTVTVRATSIKPDYVHNDDIFTMSIPHGYTLAPSKYIKNEYGVFTKTKIKKNDIIGTYEGIVCFMQTKKKNYDDLYRACYSKYCQHHGSYLLKSDKYDISVGKKVIDASIQKHASFTRYINSGFPNYYYNNCIYINDNGSIVIQAIRDIYPGEELLANYGINSESNILDTTVTVKVLSIDPINATVTFSRHVKNRDEHTTETMQFEAFRDKYHETLVEYLKHNKKQNMYKARMKGTMIVQKDRYTLQELESFRDTELKLFLSNIKKVLANPNFSKMSELKKKHYGELLDYYKNKKSI
jgi:hypothetical protein